MRPSFTTSSLILITGDVVLSVFPSVFKIANRQIYLQMLTFLHMNLRISKSQVVHQFSFLVLYFLGNVIINSPLSSLSCSKYSGANLGLHAKHSSLGF